MTHPFRAIVSDLDGTLLNADHKIGQYTIETLSKLSQQGVDIFFATGRNYPDVKHIISKVNVNEAMLITSNGARANFLSGQTVLNHYLPEDIAFQLMNIPFDSNRVCLNSYQGDEWFINVDIEQLKKYHKDSGYSYQVVDFSKHHGRQTEKVFFIGKAPEDLVPIEQYIKAKFGDRIYMTYSALLCLEVMNKSVSKGNALEELVKLRGYELKDCLAFGDGMNDIEMLSKVGKGCIMRNNAHESVAAYIRATFGIL